MKFKTILLFSLLLVGLSFDAMAKDSTGGLAIAGIQLEFIIFGLTLVGVAIFHHKVMYVALTGLTAILIYKYLLIDGFSILEHITGDEHVEGEWRILLNLLGLLFGFAILAKHFEESHIPEILPKYLPDKWYGGLILLSIIFILSSFLDNIAAAMIGGTVAMVVFQGRVHMGFLAAIIAASNAGGSGSVVGDTTTTLMWIDGVSPFDVVHAFIAAIAALFVFGTIATFQQYRHQRIVYDETHSHKIIWKKILVVILILAGTILTNYLLDFPALGVWAAILLGALFTTTPWHELKKVWQGTIFLVALVTCASLMPVDELPPATWQSAFSLGFISAVFDNIPLTKLCLDQGGYDWGVLAYAVGFGGSMIWFGSSAGVALSNMYPQTKSTVKYLKNGWHVIIAYVIGFFVLFYTIGWHPHAPHRKEHMSPAQVEISE
ncbi:MAG: hypothetical protein U5K79_09685 [Cyclobacteriaceae bacterium]|nr:hypothetical protein [Cyclobacteriaceae bacterium]